MLFKNNEIPPRHCPSTFSIPSPQSFASAPGSFGLTISHFYSCSHYHLLWKFHFMRCLILLCNWNRDCFELFCINSISLDGACLELFHIKNFVAIFFQLVEEVLKLKNEMGPHYISVRITSLQYIFLKNIFSILLNDFLDCNLTFLSSKGPSLRHLR